MGLHKIIKNLKEVLNCGKNLRAKNGNFLITLLMIIDVQ